MSRLFYHTMQDNLGNLLFDVSGTMRLAGTGTLATIYGDAALTVVLPNPMTNHPSYGSFKCYLGSGAYDFYMAKAGYSFETLTGLPGHGTMALQDATGVAVTGGTAQLTSLSILTAALAGVGVTLLYDRTAGHGAIIRPNTDAGPGAALLFVNQAQTAVGSIVTTGSATTYNTTSDSRLKDHVEPLTGALDVMRALNPVSFLWKADGTPGRGFLAHEVAEVVDGVITGEADELNPDGTINPQMIDYSKLVPYLIGAVKELTLQVEALTVQLAEAGA